MTGFARDECSLTLGRVTYSWVWEGKSLNNKALDLKCRMPSWLDALEAEIRKSLKGKITRGSVVFNLQLRGEAGQEQVHLNEQALDEVLKAIEQVKLRTECALPSADGILGLRHVLTTEEQQQTDEERAELVAALKDSYEKVLAQLITARQDEGKALQCIVTGLVDEIERLTNAAATSAETIPETIRQRVETQLKDLLGQSLPEDRLAQEAAMMAVKADVREEIDRLVAHIAAARDLLTTRGPIGRKFDFLTQEFNREANTLCSKAQTIELKQLGLELKTVIDQLREQIQNVE
jgi:uncharacterized protein (TIGR00255 family)